MFVPAGPIITDDFDFSGVERSLKPWLPDGRTCYVSNGRSAIYRALIELQISRGAAALLPSYLCDSVVASFRAHRCPLLFFSVDRFLRLDLDEIEGKIRANDVRVLFIIHYFGFPVAEISELKQLCLDYHVVLIEDCAHALFSQCDGKFLGSAGDASIFSLRKSLAIPEGGILNLRGQEYCNDPSEGCRWKAGEFIGLMRELFYWLEFQMSFSIRTLLLSADRFRGRVYELDRCNPIGEDNSMGKISGFFMNRLRPEGIAAARRKNFCYWLENLHRLRGPGIPLFQTLPEGICPIGFPVLVENRDEVRHMLYRRGIAMRTYWDVLPYEIDKDSFPEAIYLRDRILVLPVHQSLNSGHLDVVLEALG